LADHRIRVVRACALGLILAALLAGCASLRKSIDRINRAGAASTSLQNFIQDQLTTKFHRSVRSVSCTPYLDQVPQDSSAHLHCVVRFTNGTSYTTPATINDPSNDTGYSYAYYTYSFDDPPGTDITTAPLPAPTVTLAATSPASLFDARNLEPVVKRLAARFGSHDLIVQLALYPGQLEAVIATNGTAWAVTAAHAGTLTVGKPATFSGSRSGIEFSQLVPTVIQHLAERITVRGRVPLSHIDRFVLTNSLAGGDSGWNIYLTSSTPRFQARVLGDHLEIITPSGTHPLH
jgi:hypothetical protein